MSRLLSIGRSAAAVLVGLLSITLLVESVEFLGVAAVNGGFLTAQEPYFAIRNRPAFLAAKLVYNLAAAVIGGWLAARIAGRGFLAHGIVLALVQTTGFLAGIADPAIRSTGPIWMWVVLIPLTAAGILLGARLASPRVAAVWR